MVSKYSSTIKAQQLPRFWRQLFIDISPLVMGQVQSMRCTFVYAIYIYLHESAGCQLVCLSEWS